MHPISNSTILISDTFRLPGIPSEKTLHFDQDLVYHESMDNAEQQSFKCYSLKKGKLIWSNSINTLGINEGVMTSQGEYVVPTLSDTVYLFNPAGNYRVLKLKYRCKISPLVYHNNIILQDRGIGLKSFDSYSLTELWVIKQESSNTMSQPLLMNEDIIYILDDNSLQSANALTGKVNWKKTISDPLSLYFIYGHFENEVFLLSVNAKEGKKIIAINCLNGDKIWETKLNNTINEFERDMIVLNDIIYVKGDSNLINVNLENGMEINTPKLPSRITTNLVVNKEGNLLFGLENNQLVQLDRNGSIKFSKPFLQKLNRLYRNGDNIFLYSYPYFYLLNN